MPDAFSKTNTASILGYICRHERLYAQRPVITIPENHPKITQLKPVVKFKSGHIRFMTIGLSAWAYVSVWSCIAIAYSRRLKLQV